MKSIAEYHPALTAGYFALTAGFAMFCMNPVLLGISLTGALLLLFARNGRKAFRECLWLLALMLVLAAVNPLVSHNGQTVLFLINDTPITWEASAYGMTAAVMVAAVLCWFRSFSQIMTADKLMCLFGGLSPKASLVFSTALRYIPLFTDRAKQIHLTQKALGLYREDTLVDRIRGRLREFSILTTWVLQGGIVTADSMAARGWGLGRRTSFHEYRFGRSDAVLLAVLIACAAVTAAAGGHMAWTFYPCIVPPTLSPRTAAGYAAYAVLALIPVILEAVEALKWKYYESRM